MFIRLLFDKEVGNYCEDVARIYVMCCERKYAYHTWGREIDKNYKSHDNLKQKPQSYSYIIYYKANKIYIVK